MSDVDASVTEFLRRFAAELGTAPPTAAELVAGLALAGEAAHASARQAAPLACWLAARAGVDLDTALAVARRLAEPSA